MLALPQNCCTSPRDQVRVPILAFVSGSRNSRFAKVQVAVLSGKFPDADAVMEKGQASLPVWSRTPSMEDGASNLREKGMIFFRG